MLSARFDRAALRPPAPLPAGQTRHPAQAHAAWPALQRWCLAGADLATQRALAHALCLERDGSLQLQACRTVWGRLQLCAATKLHDAVWWRERQPAEAWDCGHVIDTPAGLQALTRFTPRRATLVVADDLPKTTLHSVIDVLRSHTSTLRQPVRLLLLGALPAAPSTAILLIDVDRSL